ncbi:circadian clock-controlled protein daywake-like [Schistocerca gregaria]|uniref:circadian clock-controlled protein daywake-like n=1 Tax=Schistocerca gregaria TaxID=7010 RepID=UPI00211E1189|nr:circadian clock-controlled protein daywake-like [Schistocerca gregaria]
MPQPAQTSQQQRVAQPARPPPPRPQQQPPPLLRLLALLLALTLPTACTSAAVIKETPEYVRPCARSDPELSACIGRAIDHLRPFIVKGIPELAVPTIEPLVIPRLSMENGNGAVRVRAAFHNVTIVGASNYTVSTVKADMTTYRIDVGLRLPSIETTGRYDVSGNILLFPVRSRGEFWAGFYDIAAVVRVFGKEVATDGEKFMRIDKLLVDFNLSKSRFRIKDFLNTGNVLGEAMNQFLNQNANEIIKEMKPAAAQSISRHFKEYLNVALLRVPIRIWLRDQ